MGLMDKGAGEMHTRSDTESGEDRKNRRNREVDYLDEEGRRWELHEQSRIRTHAVAIRSGG